MDFSEDPLLKTAVGFSFVEIMSTQIKTETESSEQAIVQVEPMQRLASLLETLASIYQEAGIAPQSARQAALADLECTFTILPLAA